LDFPLFFPKNELLLPVVFAAPEFTPAKVLSVPTTLNIRLPPILNWVLALKILPAIVWSVVKSTKLFSVEPVPPLLIGKVVVRLSAFVAFRTVALLIVPVIFAPSILFARLPFVTHPTQAFDNESALVALKVLIEYGEDVICWRGVKVVKLESAGFFTAISRKRFAPDVNGLAPKSSETVKMPFETLTAARVSGEPI
jgi:hypothetical protein